MSVIDPDDQQREHLADLLETWRSVTTSLIATLDDPDNLDRWYHRAKADAATWSPEARTSVSLAACNGEFLEERFNPEFVEEFRRQRIEHEELPSDPWD